MMNGKWSYIFGAVISAIFLAACSSKTNTPISNGVTIANSNGSISISSHGNSLSEGAAIPSSFPKSVPLPNDYKVVAVINGNNTSSQSYFEVELAVTGPVSSAANSYKSLLTSKGFTITSSGGGSETTAVIGSSSQWSVEATFMSSTTSANGFTFKANQLEVMLIVQTSQG